VAVLVLSWPVLMEPLLGLTPGLIDFVLVAVIAAFLYLRVIGL
jgi:hypothetical protein